jgi:hypothetical protein
MKEEVTKYPVVKNTINNLFRDQETELVNRPASYIIKLKDEKKDKIVRIIILPPKGHTSNKLDETSPHPETRKATVLIKGGIKQDNKNFSVIKNAIKFSYYLTRDIEVVANYPYAPVNRENKNYKEEIKSSREKFYVVEENGKGFYHNLINLSSEWILLVLEKELGFQKNVNLENKTRNLPKNKQDLVKKFVEVVKMKGDKIFDQGAGLVNDVAKFSLDEILPILIELLNIPETGKHEQCTVYSIILKLGKKDKRKSLEYLKKALENNYAQPYYLKELINKLK